jgi:hypothetical protein
VYQYRVFIETAGADTDAWHFTSERLYEGAIFRVNRPATDINGTPVTVYKIDSHPKGDAPGIAHARTGDARAKAGMA